MALASAAYPAPPPTASNCMWCPRGPWLPAVGGGRGSLFLLPQPLMFIKSQGTQHPCSRWWAWPGLLSACPAPPPTASYCMWCPRGPWLPAAGGGRGRSLRQPTLLLLPQPLIVCGVPGDPGSLRQVVGVAGASVSLPCSSYHSLYPTASTALLMWFHEANTDPFYRCVGFLLGIFLVSLNQNPCASKIVQRELRKGIKKLGLWQTDLESETTNLRFRSMFR